MQFQDMERRDVDLDSTLEKREPDYMFERSAPDYMLERSAPDYELEKRAAPDYRFEKKAFHSMAARRYQGFCFKKAKSGRFVPYVCWKGKILFIV